MTSSDAGFGLLDGRNIAPISSLNPDLPNQASCAITGQVVLIWPYNSGTGTFAFRVADRDAPTHRRRLEFQGPCAKAVTALNLRAGDSVAVALDGAEWNHWTGPRGPPAEWQLQFKGKLVLQARVGDARELKEVNIDHPVPEPPAPAAEALLPPPAEESQMAATPARGEPSIPIINPITMELDEYPSPAFMKRARLSYGALFEDPEEKVEADGGIKGKGRKRTRFGRDSSSWRYASQSPSPTPEAEPETPAPTAEAAVEVEIIKPSPPKAQMADEGCQTMDVEVVPSPAQPHITEAPSATNSPVPILPSHDTQGEQHAPEHHHKSPDLVQSSTAQPSQPDKSPRTLLPAGTQTDQPVRKSPNPKPAASDKQPATPKPHAPSKTFGSTLFGNFAPSHSGYDHPRFGSASSAGQGAGMDFASQVRFGFSHTPQTVQYQQPQPLSHTASAPQRVGEDAYPESHLQPSDPSKYADMETYVDQAEQEMETEPQYAYDGNDLNPPVVESFGNAQYDMATQAQEYNPVEGGHFGADALDEGSRITSGGYALHNDEIDVDKVPPGFASFGGGLEHQILDEELEEEDAEEETHIPGEDFIENDEVQDDLDDDVALEDNDDMEYGPEGEIIETGDYDQREYNIPEEDDDELSEEDHQAELQVLTQDNNPDVVEEDGLIDDRMDDRDEEDEEDASEEDEEEGGSYDEEVEEEGYDEVDDDQGSYDEEDASSEGSYSEEPDDSNAFYDNVRQMWVQRGQPLPPTPRKPQAPAGEPVVIDLLSDSDDDEPPAKPVQKPVSVPTKPGMESASTASKSVEEPAPGPSGPRQDPTPTRQNLNAGDQHDAVLEPSPGPEQPLAQDDHGRRKSSGSHMYGEMTTTAPQDHSPAAGLHLPSTPPPDAKQKVTNDDDADPIPSFNGAADSRDSGGVAKQAKTVYQDERGEDGSSVAIDSSVPRSASVQQQEETGAESPEPSNKDGGDAVPAQTIHASEDQEMTDDVVAVSRPLSSVGDADQTEVGFKSTGLSKRDVAEVERLFEEVNTPTTTNEDVTMGDDGGEPVPEPVPEPEPEPAAAETTAPQKESTPQPAEQAAEIHEEKPAIVEQPQEREPEVHQEISAEKDDGLLPQVAPSSPPGSFASQAFPSSSPAKAEDVAQLPTPMDTQPNQSFVSQAPMAEEARLIPSSPSERVEAPTNEPGEELAEASTEERALEKAREPPEEPAVITETTVETHVHVEEHTSIPAEEEDEDESEGDVSIEMTDAPAEEVEEASSPAAEQDLSMVDDADLEEDLDDETLIASQLQVEIVRTTTVEDGNDQLTVIQETRRVSVSHVSSGDVSLAEVTPALEQVAADLMVDDTLVDNQDAIVEDTPMEETTIEDAPVEDAPVVDLPIDDEPTEDGAVEDAPVEDAPGEDVPIEDAAAEDAPVEPASLDDAIQEELTLEDTVDDELASEFGKQDDTLHEEDDDEMDEEEIGDLTGDSLEDVAEEEVEAEADEDVEPIEEEDAAPEIPVEEPVPEEATLNDAAQDEIAVEAEQQEPPQLQSEETAESTIGVLADDEEVLVLGEASTSKQERTISVVAEEEDMAPVDEEDVREEPEAEEVQEVAADLPKPHQKLEVLIRPQTRSRRTRGQQGKSDEPGPSEEVSTQPNAREPSPDASKAPKRATAPSTRSTRAKDRDQQAKSTEPGPSEEVSTQQSAKELSPDVSKTSKRATSGSKRTAHAKENRDPSIELAKASIQKRGATRTKLEPVPLEPRRTRQRSASQTIASARELEDEEDSSIALARAALESPSKKRSVEPSFANSATASRDLLKRLRTTLSDFTPLKSLRHHKKGPAHILAVVACDPPEPQRTKHRDYHTTVTVTDASVAPEQVVEVQFMEMHRQYLPAVKQGDTLVLKDFEIVSFPGREFALKQKGEDASSTSSWAVYGADYEVPGGRAGPDFEIQEDVRDYLHDLRVWYNELEQLDREKLVTAMTRLSESTEGAGLTG